MRSLYVEGKSPFHRLPLKLKLTGLMALAVALFLTRDPLLLCAGPLCGALVYFTLGLPLREALVRLRPVFLTIVLVALFGFAFGSAEEALLQLLRLTTLMLFAATVTATTTVSAFMEAIASFAKPLETLGLAKADDIGLAFGLVVRFVPEILARYEAIKEAHKARGLPVRMPTLIAPLIILTLKEADQIAAAIDARGLRRH